MWKKVFFGLMMLAVLASGSAWAAHHEGGFEAMAEAWETAYNSGDMKAVVAMYMEDGMRLPPDQPAAEGHEAIMAQLQAGSEMGLAKVKIEVLDTKIMGDMGAGRGTFQGMDAEGNMISSGKWANLAKMVDGKWVIYYDIFNYDAPMPMPE